MNRDRTLTVIDSIDPERLNMGAFAVRTSCGTVMCLAGWACVHAGDPPHFDPESDVTETTRSGRRIYVVAQEYLELDNRETVRLFYSFDVATTRDLRAIVDELAPAPCD